VVVVWHTKADVTVQGVGTEVKLELVESVEHFSCLLYEERPRYGYRAPTSRTLK
jgi:hypothetical protein